MQGLPITFREEREREKRRRGGEEKRRKKEDERRERREEGEEKVEKKGERIALAVALLRSGAKYISTFPSRRRRRFSLSFFFIYFFFFSTFRPGKILPRAQRTARRMRTNLCEFLNPLPPPSIILELLYSFFLSFFYVGLRLRPIDTIRAVDYYSVDRLDWNVYWKISI